MERTENIEVFTFQQEWCATLARERCCAVSLDVTNAIVEVEAIANWIGADLDIPSRGHASDSGGRIDS